MKALGIQQQPTLIKGVRGTWNKDHILENIGKGILRAKHKLTVNKDGTIRYDMTEMGCTHFKPFEIGTSVEKLKQLGYLHDKDGKPLESEEQIIEIKPQDVILPACPEAADEGADKVLVRECAFIDELLERFYGLQPYYNVKTKADLIGQLVIGLAPHTSGGVIGRIIGFSKTQGCFAHPYWHAAQRRNFDGDETCIMLALDAFLNFSRQYLPDRRGGRTMDSPLVLSTVLDPTEVDTEVHGMDICSQYPLEFYEAALKNAWPWEVTIEQVKTRLGKVEQYEGISYTRESSDLNAGVRYSAYKSIPTMLEKLEGQLDLSRKLRGVNVEGVASLVIDKHFIRDIKGNLRKFTQQEFRCVVCNNKYRRTPLSGTCSCGGRLLFTISEGSIKKYLDASMKLVAMDGVHSYMRQSMELLQRRIESIFGRDVTKQIELKEWFGK
jgi:DNA polymerase II large subunit